MDLSQIQTQKEVNNLQQKRKLFLSLTLTHQCTLMYITTTTTTATTATTPTTTTTTTTTSNAHTANAIHVPRCNLILLPTTSSTTSILHPRRPSDIPTLSASHHRARLRHDFKCIRVWGHIDVFVCKTRRHSRFEPSAHLISHSCPSSHNTCHTPTNAPTATTTAATCPFSAIISTAATTHSNRYPSRSHNCARPSSSKRSPTSSTKTSAQTLRTIGSLKRGLPRTSKA
mmetsp:Transcript_38297/g.62050  ORF Transcript_38297/g.62050 Transcript_38297/m.62050 type:complete len:229 (+) Transcript_38297:410-1096(+)